MHAIQCSASATTSRVTGGGCNGDAQLRTVAWRSVERLSHFMLPVSHTLRGYVSFAKACKRPSVRSWCSTTFCVKSAPRHCAREPFKSIWRLYRKILDQSKRVPSHERTVHTVLLEVDTNAYSLPSILMPHLLPCALPLMLAKHGNFPTKMITHLAHEATCTFKVCFAHCLLVESSL